MDMASSIGTIFPPKIQKVMISWNIMKGSGGVDCLMVKEFIRSWMEISIWVFLKMDWNMGKEPNGLLMATITKESMWMDYPKVMGSISGKTAVLLKVILNKVLEMVMVYGRRTAKSYKSIKGTMPWTKRQVMECIAGRVDGATKVTSRTTFVMDMDSSMMAKQNWTIAVFGRTERKVTERW